MCLVSWGTRSLWNSRDFVCVTKMFFAITFTCTLHRYMFFDFKSVCSCLCSATHYCNYKDHNKCHSPGQCPLWSSLLGVIIFGVLRSLTFGACVTCCPDVVWLWRPPSLRSTPSSTQQSLVSNVCVTLLHIVHYLPPSPCCQLFPLDQ